VNIFGFGARTREWGKHRKEVTEVTEGGFWVGGRKNLVNAVGFGARTREGGRHRTEVAEVKEEDWRTRIQRINDSACPGQ
jgi:hypothetical protein